MSRLVQIAAVAAVALLPAVAQAEAASAWTQGFHSRARLISGGSQDGRLLAGLEIVLDPGFKTYWRNPGEAGLPPRFDWSGSSNAGAVDVQWPAPERTEDAGGVAYGYHDRIVFPVIVRPDRQDRPVTLSVAVEYGVCKEICIPARAELVFTLTGDAGHRPAVQAALDAVPRQQDIDAPGPLSVLGIEPIAADRFAVRVRAPEGVPPVLFVEGPDNWYLSPEATPQDGRFLVTVDEKPTDAVGPVPLRLTLKAGAAAIETEVHLDAGLTSR